MYRGAQQEFQTRRLIPVCFCTVIGQWFIHPQCLMVWITVAKHNIPHRLNIYGICLTLPDGSDHATVQTGLCPASIQSTFLYDFLGRRRENELPGLFRYTTGKEWIYCDKDWKNLWDEMFSSGRLPGQPVLTPNSSRTAAWALSLGIEYQCMEARRYRLYETHQAFS